MPPVPPAKIGPYEVIELLGVGGMGEVYRSDDCVKVLDFGLAKALSDDSSPADPSASPTLSATRAGIVLGTPAYMSPEQARGRIVDRRTDIWSFGCVLFEMLTGKSAFTGETVTDTLAATGPHADDWVCYAAPDGDCRNSGLARTICTAVDLFSTLDSAPDDPAGTMSALRGTA